MGGEKLNDLRERRKARGLTLADVASAAKTTPVTISRYERKPSVKMAKVLGPLYGVPWTDFYKDVA